jgi:hypothetical protein
VDARRSLRRRPGARFAAAAALAWLVPLAVAAQELAPDVLFAQAAGSVYIVLAADNADLKALMGNPVVPPPETTAEGATGPAMSSPRERALRESGRGQRPPLSLGSAVALGPDIAATNCHVVANRQVVALVEGNNGALAQVVDSRPNDICLLRVTGFALKPVRSVRRSAELRVGERAYAIGNPRGLERTLSEGLVSGMRTRAGVRIVQTTAPISPGSSGGGLFDAQGNLIGITTFKSRSDPQLNFAVATEEFWPLPATLPAAAAPRPPAMPPAAPPAGPGRLVLQDDLTTKCGPIQVRGIRFVTTAFKCVEGQQRRIGTETVESTRLSGLFRGGSLEVDHVRIAGERHWSAMSADQLKRAVESWAKPANGSGFSPFEANPFPHYKFAVVFNGQDFACAHGTTRGGPGDKVMAWITYCEPGSSGPDPENLATAFRALQIE